RLHCADGRAARSLGAVREAAPRPHGALRMLRPAVLLPAVTAAIAGPLQAQPHMAHHHPRGAKIVMPGTIVHPVCTFAHEMPDSAQAPCSQQHPSAGLEPVLLAEGELYLLAFDHAGASRGLPTEALIGKAVKVDGTVYPAGSSYLIVVDSIRALAR